MMEQLSTAATVQRTVQRDDRNLLHRRYATLDVATNG